MRLAAGTGLCSLTAAARGADVLATDYRPEPLQLLRASAAASTQPSRGVDDRGGDGGLEVETAVFDIKGDEPLPRADVLVAADLLYLRSTSEALARR